MSAEFLTLTSVYFLALLSPGQDFFLILRNALQYGYKTAWWNCIGIALGNAFYIVLAYVGHGLLVDYPFIILIIEFGGALFLMYLGYMLINAPKPKLAQNSLDPKPSRYKLLSSGFFSALLNPKNALFYLSILFTIVSFETSLHVRIFYALWMIVLLLVWDMAVALFFGNTKALKLLPWLNPLQKIIGIFLALFGVKTLWKLWNL